MGKVGKSLKFLIFREEFLYITCRESMVYHPIGLFFQTTLQPPASGLLKKHTTGANVRPLNINLI